MKELFTVSESFHLSAYFKYIQNIQDFPEYFGNTLGPQNVLEILSLLAHYAIYCSRESDPDPLQKVNQMSPLLGPAVISEHLIPESLLYSSSCPGPLGL